MLLVAGKKNSGSKRISTPTKREKRTIFGCLNLRTKKFYWKSVPKGNSLTFISFIHQLRRNFPNKNLLIIVDNASIHKSKKVQLFLEKYNEITLYHLPTYSPEFNPVEKIWWWIKPKVYGLFEFKNGLEELLKRFRKLVFSYNNNNLISQLELKLDIYKDTITFNAD